MQYTLSCLYSLSPKWVCGLVQMEACYHCSIHNLAQWVIEPNTVLLCTLLYWKRWNTCSWMEVGEPSSLPTHILVAEVEGGEDHRVTCCWQFKDYLTHASSLSWVKLVLCERGTWVPVPVWLTECCPLANITLSLHLAVAYASISVGCLHWFLGCIGPITHCSLMIVIVLEWSHMLHVFRNHVRLKSAIGPELEALKPLYTVL